MISSAILVMKDRCKRARRLLPARGGPAILRKMEDFQTNPPHKFYIVKVPPLPIAVETTNILATYISCRYKSWPHTLSTDVFLRLVSILFTAVRFNSNSLLLLHCTTFIKFIIMTPQIMVPYLKMNSPNSARFWKWSPSQLPGPLSQTIKHPAQKHQKNWHIEGVYSLRF